MLPLDELLKDPVGGKACTFGKDPLSACMGACRLGRVIVWLEELAGSDMDRAEAEAETTGSSGAFFTPGEGLPRETLARMEQSAVLAQMRPAASHAMVSQLDPDAPTR